MPASPNLPGWLEGLAGEVRRVSERLRTMSDTRLARPADGATRTRASAALALAQRLADLAQGVEERAAPAAPVPRPVPDVGPFVVGDQVAVTGRDLVSALAAAGPDGLVWADGRRVPAQAVHGEAVAALRRLRLAL